MFIIGIMEAVGSITSIYITRSGSGVCISTASESGTNLNSDNIVARGV